MSLQILDNPEQKINLLFLILIHFQLLLPDLSLQHLTQNLKNNRKSLIANFKLTLPALREDMVGQAQVEDAHLVVFLLGN